MGQCSQEDRLEGHSTSPGDEWKRSELGWCQWQQKGANNWEELLEKSSVYDNKLDGCVDKEGY